MVRKTCPELGADLLGLGGRLFRIGLTELRVCRNNRYS